MATHQEIDNVLREMEDDDDNEQEIRRFLWALFELKFNNFN